MATASVPQEMDGLTASSRHSPQISDYEPQPLPAELRYERTLEVVPTPGHSRTHVIFHERATGVVFTGDLLVSTGAAALMTRENPWELVDSLRRVADLGQRGSIVADAYAR